MYNILKKNDPKIIFSIFFIFSILSNNVDIPILTYGRFKVFEFISLVPILFIGLSNFFNKDKYIFDLLKSFLICLFTLSLVAAFFQISFKPIIYSLTFCCFVFSLYLFSNVQKNNWKFNLRDIIETIILICFVFLILSLIFGGNKYGSEYITTFRFRGIFNNSNQLGRFAALTSLISIIYIIEYNNISKLSKHISYFNILCGSLFLLFSNSRSAILVFVISLIFYFIILEKEKKNALIKNIKKNFFLYIYLFFILFLVGHEGILNIFLKFKDFRIEEGITSYRLNFLQSSYEYLNFFGYKNFKNETDICVEFFKVWPRIECDIHNLYLNIFLNFGGIFLLIFILLILFIFIDSYKKKLFNKIERVYVLVLIIFSSTMYLFENGILYTNFMLVFLFYGFLCRTKKS